MGPINVGAVRRQHALFMRGFEQALDQDVEDAADEAKQRVWQSNDLKHRTRNLARSTKTKIIRTKSGRIVKVQNDAKYAKAVNSGSRPHVIRAKRGKALRFVVGGKVIFRRQVMHPGTQPTLFLKRATEFAFIKLGRSLSVSHRGLTNKFRRARA